jgi:glucan phosphoethanolaminetransferase (alkaline phosphatase superfamily)
MRSTAKVIATAAWLLVAPLAWIPIAVSKTQALLAVDVPLLATLYFITAVVGALAVAGAPFIRNRWVRWPLVTLFLVGFGTNYVARSVQGEPLSTHMLATFIQAKQEIGHAVGTYGKDIIVGVLLVVVLAPWLLMQPEPKVSLGSRFLLVPATALSLTALFIGFFSGRVEEFPSPIAVPLQTYFAAREATVYLGPREALTYVDPISSRVAKVILVVDESVRGDYLQLNNDVFDNTPFLVSALPSLANFGIATSYSNCSATARVALRSGARDTDFPDPRERILHQPTFWQFAKKAHYRTVFVDTWLPIRKMSSMLTYDELKYVDERTDVSLSPYWEADDRVADLIIKEMARPEPTLLFVEKIGLHTPYRRNLPPNPGYVPRPGAVPHQDLDSERAANVRDYSVGVWWRVDRFFQRLLPAINKPGVLLIYTSDHGQALYDKGYEASNCSGSNAAKGEGMVPLFVFAGDQPFRQAFQTSAARSFNKATHSDVFPTLLWAMGFDPNLVQPRYTDGLLEIPAHRTRRFFVFSPFGNEMQWVPVD